MSVFLVEHFIENRGEYIDNDGVTCLFVELRVAVDRFGFIEVFIGATH